VKAFALQSNFTVKPGQAYPIEKRLKLIIAILILLFASIIRFSVKMKNEILKLKLDPILDF